MRLMLDCEPRDVMEADKIIGGAVTRAYELGIRDEAIVFRLIAAISEQYVMRGGTPEAAEKRVVQIFHETWAIQAKAAKAAEH